MYCIFTIFVVYLPYHNNNLGVENMNPFFSDITLFSGEIHTLIETQNMPVLLQYLHEKHKEELDIERPVQDKRNDLIIWNAFLTMHIVRMGIFKDALHPLYNRYYKKILSANNLKDLQDLETEMFQKYLQSMATETQTTEHYTVNKILQYIHINIENHISLNSIARTLNLSEGYISSAFHKVMGISVMQYVKEVKIERAKKYLSSTRMSILEISDLLGFFDSSHFSRTFKSITGITPTEFRSK